MPAIVGAIQVVNVSGSGVFHVGDVYKIFPISNVKTKTGPGSFNTGERVTVTNTNGQLTAYDSDFQDLPIQFNV
ncbi:MAG: spore germination protein [Bacillus sp. (in: firmicutes)]